MQWPHRPGAVPPGSGQAIEAIDFGGNGGHGDRYIWDWSPTRSPAPLLSECSMLTKPLTTIGTTQADTYPPRFTKLGVQLHLS
jgi:hypothetical protein